MIENINGNTPEQTFATIIAEFTNIIYGTDVKATKENEHRILYFIPGSSIRAFYLQYFPTTESIQISNAADELSPNTFETYIYNEIENNWFAKTTGSTRMSEDFIDHMLGLKTEPQSIKFQNAVDYISELFINQNPRPSEESHGFSLTDKVLYAHYFLMNGNVLSIEYEKGNHVFLTVNKNSNRMEIDDILQVQDLFELVQKAF